VPSGGFLNGQPLHLGFSSSFSPTSSAPLSRKSQSFFDCPLFFLGNFPAQQTLPHAVMNDD